MRVLDVSFFSQFDQQRFNARFNRVQKTQAHRAIVGEYCESMEEGKRQRRKISAQYKKKKSSDGTAQRVGKQLAQLPSTSHFSFLVLRLSFWSIFQARRPMVVRTFFSFIRISTSNMRWSCIAEVYCLAIIFYFFWLLRHVQRYDIHDSMFMFLIFPLLVAQSKRQPWSLTEMKLGAKKRRPNW